MGAAGQEKIDKVCPITGGVCTCEKGPHEERIPIDLNQETSYMTIEKCGEIAVTKTFAEEIQEQVRDNTIDD